MKTIFKDKIFNINTNLLCNNGYDIVTLKEFNTTFATQKIADLELNYANGDLNPENELNKFENFETINYENDGKFLMKVVTFNYLVDSKDVLDTGDFYCDVQYHRDKGEIENLNFIRVESKKLLTTDYFLYLARGAFYVNGYINNKISISFAVMTYDSDGYGFNKLKLAIKGSKIYKQEKLCIYSNTDRYANVYSINEIPLINSFSGVLNESTDSKKFKIKNFVSLDTLSKPKYATAYIMYPADCDVEIKIQQKGYSEKTLIIKKGNTYSNELEVDDFWKVTTISDIKACDNSIYEYDQNKYNNQLPELKKTLGKRLADNILTNYNKPRQSVNLSAAITNKEDIFEIGEKVKIIMISAHNANLINNFNSDVSRELKNLQIETERKYSFALYDDGNPKIFKITSVEIKYNGSWRQNLEMIEVPFNKA